MRAQCTSAQLSFQPLGRRHVAAAFDAGPVSSDGGVALLREVDEQAGLTDAFAACFLDVRDPVRVQHSVLQLVRQRVFGIALGHEDVSEQDLRRANSDGADGTAAALTAPQLRSTGSSQRCVAPGPT